MAVSAVTGFKQQTQALDQQAKSLSSMSAAQKSNFFDDVKKVHVKVKAHLLEKSKNEPHKLFQADGEICSLLLTLKTLKKLEEDTLVKDIRERTQVLLSRVDSHSKDKDDENYKGPVQELQDLARTFLENKWGEKKGKVKSPSRKGETHWAEKSVAALEDSFAIKFREKHEPLVSLLTILQNISEPDKETVLTVRGDTYGAQVDVKVNIATEKLGDLKEAAEKALQIKIKEISFNDKTESDMYLREIVSLNKDSIPVFWV